MAKLDLIQFGDDGTLLIRYILDNGTYHRTSVIPMGIESLNAHLVNFNDHLSQLNRVNRSARREASVQNNYDSIIRAVASIVHTPERVAETKQRILDQIKSMQTSTEMTTESDK